MKILYDHQIFSLQKFGGISRYFVELMSGLPKDFGFNNTLLYSENIYLKNAFGKFNKGIHLKIPELRGKTRLIRILNAIETINSKLALRKNDYDLFHPTYYNPYFLNYINKPYVITVYDMIHEKFPDMFKNDQTSIHKRKSILNANRIIAISQSTKNDLINIYGLPDEKIDVVHLGHSIDVCASSPVANLPEKYVLYVGQRSGYKNFERFLKAFSLVNSKHPDVKLVCTGVEFNISEKSLISSLKLDKKIYRYFVSDNQLTYLYQNAICFVYPSLYEGFGIPILEAFAAKCPLVLSNTSCFPEIAQNGGVYFDPYEVDNIAHSINLIIEDEKLQCDKINKGLEVLSKYSWKRMARETSEIYKIIID